jgi:serine/threonine protein kinase
VTFPALQEFCNGGSLRQALNKGYYSIEGMPHRWSVISMHLRAIAEGMDYMHSKRICHGDLNPSNILFKVRGWRLFCIGLVMAND